MIEIARDVAPVFWDSILRALKEEKVKTIPEIHWYLVLLLERFVRQDHSLVLDEPLSLRLYKATWIGVPHLQSVREIGDAALFTAGIVAPKFRRSVGVDHYVGVAESSYRILRSLVGIENDFFAVYQEFSRDIRPFVRVLHLVGRDTIFKSEAQTLLEVCERYLASGKEEDKRWLEARGVFLIPGEDPRSN